MYTVHTGIHNSSFVFFFTFYAFRKQWQQIQCKNLFEWRRSSEVTYWSMNWWWRRWWRQWVWEHILSFQFQCPEFEISSPSTFPFSSPAFAHCLCVFCHLETKSINQSALNGIECFECHICESKFFCRCVCVCPVRRFSSHFLTIAIVESSMQSYHSLSISGSWPKKNCFFAECKLCFVLLADNNIAIRHFCTCDQIKMPVWCG